eukprot:14297906-Alexandrium_andersonii.AAC.1
MLSLSSWKCCVLHLGCSLLDAGQRIWRSAPPAGFSVDGAGGLRPAVAPSGAQCPAGARGAACRARSSSR